MYLHNKPTAYVYYVKNLSTGKYYYGSRFAHVKKNISSENDFWVRYFTSSPEIKRLIKEYGADDFLYSIVFESEDFGECFTLEQYLIENSVKDPLCMNKAFIKNTRVVYYQAPSHYGKSLNITEEIRKKMGSPWRGKKQPKDFVEKRMKAIHENNPRTDEWNKNIGSSVKKSYENPSEAMLNKYKGTAEGNKLWCWITNGHHSQKVKKSEINKILSERNGWKRGRATPYVRFES